jgi:hypothetical protein
LGSAAGDGDDEFSVGLIEIRITGALVRLDRSVDAAGYSNQLSVSTGTAEFGVFAAGVEVGVPANQAVEIGSEFHDRIIDDSRARVLAVAGRVTRPVDEFENWGQRQTHQFRSNPRVRDPWF